MTWLGVSAFGGGALGSKTRPGPTTAVPLALLRCLRGPMKMTRRRSRIVLLIVSLLVASTAVAAGSHTATADTTSPRILFGAYPDGASQDRQAAVLALESQLGRPLAGVRVFDVWDEPFPSSYDIWLRDTGHAEFLSVRAKRANGSVILWRSIANAQPGSTIHNEIVGWADSLKAYGAPLYFTFNHEPEAAASDANGTATDFIDAWRKVISVFRDQGVTNATYVFVMTSYAFWVTDGRAADLWYPGDAYVDAVGEDAYNWYNCRPGVNNPWRTLEWIAAHLRDWGPRPS